MPLNNLPAIFCVAKIPLQLRVHPRHWLELHSPLPRPPLQLLPPVQLNIRLDGTLGGLLVGLSGDVELVSFQHLIYINITIKLLLKVLINRPVIMGVTNSSQSRTSPLHHCRSLPGPVPWLLSMMIPLV